MKALQDLAELKKRIAKLANPGPSANRLRVTVGLATCGITAGAKPVYETIIEECQKHHLDQVTVNQVGCLGECALEPIVEVFEPCGKKTTYVHVDKDLATQIVDKHLIQGTVLKDHTIENFKFGENKGSRAHILITEDSQKVNDQSLLLKMAFRNKLGEMRKQHEVDVLTIRDLHFKEGQVVIIYPGETIYKGVTLSDVDHICEEHFLHSHIYEPKVCIPDEEEKEKLSSYRLVGFYHRQLRIALRNCGIIDPDSIEEYIGRNGYEALGKVLNAMSPNEVIEEMKKSGLRGRGGGGFSTGLKWSLAAKNSGQKYVICNADEGDPGAFMDRAVLEGDPHSIIEAMEIAGYAIGSSQGYIYCRAEYPLAVARLNKAIKQAYEYHLLGKGIFGTNFNFDLEVRLGAGAFVCGEETALMASIEGERGMPRNKPPFPADQGLWGRPTIINNVETLANVPMIILNGSLWFSQIGTEKSKGTKVFALGGKIKHTGLAEIPMGTTLREVIYDIGGGILKDKSFKAVQTGGPSGGCLTAADLDTPIDYDNLIEKGSMMGSGGMIIMDEDNCMVDVARFYLEFTVDESCGKCTPCREGTRRMLEILKKITGGKGTPSDLKQLENLAHMIKDTALCGLGQTAPNPVLSTLANFRDEYIAHVIEKKCPAGVCTALTNFKISNNCIGCGKCKRNCPVSAIKGEIKKPHEIDTSICIKCGNCRKGCPVGAIIVG
jgi:NADH-quinone oxidoreductase subunit F/NADP-reducing hydrogenase subunit HndC